MPEVIEIALWVLGAVVKFVVTPSLMIARGWGFWATVGVSSMGAAFGVGVFFYFGKWILKKWAAFKGEKEPKTLFHSATPSGGALPEVVRDVGASGCKWTDFGSDFSGVGS